MSSTDTELQRLLQAKATAEKASEEAYAAARDANQLAEDARNAVTKATSDVHDYLQQLMQGVRAEAGVKGKADPYTRSIGH